MTAITQQKADLTAIIMRRLERKLENADIEAVKRVAIGACRRLASRMTLKELQGWNDSLTMIDEMEQIRESREAGRC